MPNSISWDDWQIVDAIATTGTTARAANQLGLNQSTVFRRISQLEAELGVRLFDRSKRGFHLTVQGEAILPDIKRLSVITTDIERQVSGLDLRLSGDVRVSVNSTLVRYLLVDELKAFGSAHPDIRVHLDLSDRLVNIREREADLVIRGSNDPDPDLYGRKLMRLHMAVYASSVWVDLDLQTRAFITDPTSLDWVLWEGDLLMTSPGRWMKTVLKDVTPRFTTTDVETSAYLAEAGLGCAVLPRFFGDRHLGLTRISENIPGVYTDLWVLTHEDLRKTARVSALLKFIAGAIRQTNEIPSPAPGVQNT